MSISRCSRGIHPFMFPPLGRLLGLSDMGFGMWAGTTINDTSSVVISGKFLIVMAMVAIGLNTNIKKLLTQGLKPVVLGICCWIAVAGASLLVQGLIRVW